MPTENQAPETHNAKNALEWAVFGISIVLISALLIYMSIKAFDHKFAPPALAIKIGTPTRSGEIHSVPVTVENAGQVTAQNVEIEVEFGNEKSGFVLAYVPRRGHAQGFATFEKPVAKSQLKARIVGYTD